MRVFGLKPAGVQRHLTHDGVKVVKSNKPDLLLSPYCKTMPLMIQQALEALVKPGGIGSKRQCSLKGDVFECAPNCHLGKTQGTN